VQCAQSQFAWTDRRSPFVVITAVMFMAATLWLSATPATAASKKGSSGSFSVAGSVSGTLKVPAFFEPGSALTGCVTQNGTDTISWMTMTLKVAGKTSKLTNVTLSVAPKFGGTVKLSTSATSPSHVISLSTTSAYAWQDTTGTVTTTKSGSSGSLNATLKATNGHAGTVTIKGSRSGCASQDI
jgi:hypothetical protein